MKITLDHNCIIHLENDTDVGKAVRAIVTSIANECFVVNIGASEMRKKGVRPDRYEKFEELLGQVGISHLPRLNPMVILDVTFFDRCVFGDDSTIKLAGKIEDALFGESERIDIATVGLDSPEGCQWLNRLCDVHGMWCHIQNGNDVFLTTDNNFSKETKLPKLLALGAGRICQPHEL
ncbi:MAG TPA: hypothetical protein DCY98_10215 [Nitrospinae bacterium]|nr:hypothetical protein [Nitrospinota bacterium]